MSAVLGYDTVQNDRGNLFATLSNNPGDPAYPVDNIWDYNTYTIHQFAVAATVSFQWLLNTAKQIDYIGFAGHTIPPGTEIRLLEGGAGGTVLETWTTSGDGPQLLIASQTHTSSFTGVEIDAGGAQVVIGSFFIGRRSDLPMGLEAPYTPPHLGREVLNYPNQTQKGANFLGGHIQRQGWQFTVEQNHVDPDWIDANWLPLVQHVERWPFFYLWDDTRPQDAVYAWVDGRIRNPRYTTPVHMQWSLPCRGLHSA